MGFLQQTKQFIEKPNESCYKSFRLSSAKITNFSLYEKQVQPVIYKNGGNKMNSFVNAIQTQEARTENGMKHQSTNSSTKLICFKIGSSRNTDIIPAFVKAFVDSPDTTTRIALWSRDIRGGANERKTFRSIVSYLSKNNPEQLKKILHKIPN